ncbi:MAG: glutamate synthase subunit alpha, partial [Planctomycetes bacterium]|nr:glutamate synthase subunit alpha [Planctomycetota bacterium]
VGKGMGGGRIVVRPPAGDAGDPVLIGNTVLYGATGGECFFAGAAGERFAVRNSGAKAVIESVGDHGCEYMTGGVVVVLGATGRNFAAGMSGGIAYVLDQDRKFSHRCNTGMVDLEQLAEADDLAELKRLVEAHAQRTGSPKAKELLANWKASTKKFVKVFPREYRRVLLQRKEREETTRREREATRA